MFFRFFAYSILRISHNLSLRYYRFNNKLIPVTFGLEFINIEIDLIKTLLTEASLQKDSFATINKGINK